MASQVGIVLAILGSYMAGALVYSFYSWLTSGEPWNSRKFAASTIMAVLVAVGEGQGVAAATMDDPLSGGWLTIILFKSVLAGAGIVGVTSKVMRNSNTKATPTRESPEPPTEG